MAVALNCTNCSAALRVDDADVRAQHTTCQFCGTLLHLTDKGTEEYKEELVKRQPPEGVTVIHADGALSVAAKLSMMGSDNTQVRSSVKPRTFYIILGISLVIGAIVFYLVRNIEGAIVMAFFATLAALIAQLMLFTKSNPALILKDGIVKTEVSMNASHIETAVHDIQQLYIATKKFGNYGSTHDLYALLNDGKRIRLYGSFDNPEIALYIEEIMEIEMGLFNLPVFGDAPAIEQAEAIPKATASSALDPCANCSAELNVSDDDRRRGFTTCQYCSTVTLLYAPNSEKPMLGLPDTNDPKLQFSIEDEAGNLTIRNNAKNVIFKIENGAPVDVADSAKFFMKQVENKKVENAGLMDFVSAALNMEQRMAYSEDIDINMEGSDEEKKQALMGWFLGKSHFDIIAKTDVGESPIIANIHDPREAALLLMTIQKHLK